MSNLRTPDAERWLHAVPDLPPQNGQELPVVQSSRPKSHLRLVENQSLELSTDDKNDLSLSGRKFMYHLVQGLMHKGKGAFTRMLEKEDITMEKDVRRNTVANHYALNRWVGGPYIPGVLVARNPDDESVRKKT
jgi:hypothetical protein